MFPSIKPPPVLSPAYMRVRREAAQVLDYPDYWLTTPNSQLGYLRPDELIEQQGAAGEQLVMDLLAAIRVGAFS